MKTILLLLLLACPLAAQVGATADTITIPRGLEPLVLRECKVTKLEPDGVRVMHSTGFAKVPWEHMPEAWKAGMHYDPAAAAEYRQKAVRAAVAPEITPEATVPAEAQPKLPEGLTTKEAVKAAWLAAADPGAVSGLFNDGEREVVGGVKNSLIARSKFKGAAKVSDAEKKRRALLAYRQEIISGMHDVRAERTALEHNITIYTAAGDIQGANACREKLAQLPPR